MTSRLTFAAAVLLGLTACDGSSEDTGEKADNASGAVAGEDNVRSGPRETSGEARDDAAASANEAREARADALEDAADEARVTADQKADTLEDRARETRDR